MKWLVGLMLCSLATAWADEQVSVCFNYGCLSQAEVVYSDAQLRELSRMMRGKTAEEEREAVALGVGRLLGWAGEQTPISADRGGNFADAGVSGKMDCIDHSTTTTRLLRMMEKRGLLRYHRVLEPALRRRFLFFDHYSAQIEEIEVLKDGGKQERYVVDSWFFDNGQPAVVMPLARWLAGEDPNVDE